MNSEKYNEQEKIIIENFFKKTDNSILSKKIAAFNNPSNLTYKDNKTSQRIDFIKDELKNNKNIMEDLLVYEFSNLIENVKTSHSKSIATSAATIFQKKRQQEILDESYRKISTWYEKMGSDWVNNNINQENVNLWGVNPSFRNIVVLLLKNEYSLSGTCDVLNSSIGRGDKELFDLAIKTSNINGSENNDKSFKTPLAQYPRMVSSRTKEENEILYEYMLNQLISFGADVNKFDNSKSSYIHLSAMSGNKHHLSKLLENGANANNEWVENEKQTSTIKILKEMKKESLVDIIEKYKSIQSEQKQSRQISLKM